MLCPGGGCSSAIATICCVAQGKLKHILPIQTTTSLTLDTQQGVRDLYFLQLCSLVAKRGNERKSNCSRSAAMTVPLSVGFVASKKETKHPQHYYNWNFAPRTLHWSYAVSDNVASSTICVLYQIFHRLSTFRHLNERRPRKTWSDVYKCGLASVDALNREA